jgi:hypothetical protein
VSTTQEEARALESARRLLIELLDPRATPRVPKSVRLRAYRVLRHYPLLAESQWLSMKGKRA